MRKKILIKKSRQILTISGARLTLENPRPQFGSVQANGFGLVCVFWCNLNETESPVIEYRLDSIHA